MIIEMIIDRKEEVGRDGRRGEGEEEDNNDNKQITTIMTRIKQKTRPSMFFAI